MAKHNIGPKIFDIFVCLNTGYIIMEKWDGTIRNIHRYIKNNHIIEISNLIVKSVIILNKSFLILFKYSLIG